MAEGQSIPALQPPLAMGWTLGKPNRVLTLPQKIQMAAEASDEFYQFDFDLGNDAPVWLDGFEVQAQDWRILRDVTVVIPNRESTPVQRSAVSSIFVGADRWLGAWMVGSTPRRNRSGAGIWVNPGEKVRVQLHYRGTGPARIDHPRIALYEGVSPSESSIQPWIIELPDFDLPPNEMQPIRSVTVEVKEPMRVHALRPRLRRFAKQVLLELERTPGRREPVLTIPSWTYQFLASYRTESSFTLRPGDRLHFTVTYDNTVSNPENPNRIPELVRKGSGPEDAAGGIVLGVTPIEPADAWGILWGLDWREARSSL